jgi:hypothetical protein
MRGYLPPADTRLHRVAELSPMMIVPLSYHPRTYPPTHLHICPSVHLFYLPSYQSLHLPNHPVGTTGHYSSGTPALHVPVSSS